MHRFGDAAAVGMAVAVVAGAWWAAPVPVAAGVALVVVALVVGRLHVLLPALLLLAAALGHVAWSGLVPPPVRSFDGDVLLVADPEEVDGAVRVDVKAGTRRLEAWARGEAASVLRARSAGQRAVVRGHTRPVTGKPWLTRRHIAGQLIVDEVEAWSEGNAVARAANGFRDLLDRGAVSLPRDARSLFTGFVLGDDRDQPLEVADDFRGSGLSHLLAVSGEIVL